MKRKPAVARAIWEVVSGVAEPLTTEQIAVACWHAHPKLFGLAGYEDRHPDRHKVITALNGVGGMVHKGYLVNVGKERYAAGAEPPETTEDSEGTLRREPVRLDLRLTPADLHAKLKRWLLVLLGRDSLEKLKTHGLSRINRVDVMEFFQARRWGDLPLKVRELEQVIEAMRQDKKLDRASVREVKWAAETLAGTLPKSLIESNGEVA